MVILHLTQKLLHLVGSPTTPTSTSTTLLGDWTGTLLHVGHRRYVLLVSEHSRLPVLMPGRDLRSLPENFPRALAEVLLGIGLPMAAVEQEVEAASSVALATTNNRSLLGTLNDFSFLLSERLLGHPDAHLVDAALWLSETPVGPLAYERPRDLVHRLLG